MDKYAQNLGQLQTPPPPQDLFSHTSDGADILNEG